MNVSLSIPPEMKLIAAVENFAMDLARILDFNDSDMHDFRLAVHETLVNAIIHGGDDRIAVNFSLLEGEIHVAVLDRGAGFPESALQDPTTTENLLKPDGRGLFIVRNVTDTFSTVMVPGEGMRIEFSKKKSG